MRIFHKAVSPEKVWSIQANETKLCLEYSRAEDKRIEGDKLKMNLEVWRKV